MKRLASIAIITFAALAVARFIVKKNLTKAVIFVVVAYYRVKDFVTGK